MNTGLAVFVKTPGRSPLKTRLARAIGQADAEQFHRLAARAVASVARAAGDLLTSYWAVAEANALDDACWQALPRLAQGEGDLGQRLHRTCSQLLARHDAALLIGADTPQITPASLQNAVAKLSEPASDFVLGPASDGGFWVFGTRVAIPVGVWQTPTYSQATTATQLRRALSRHGRLATLPTLSDVDTIEQFTNLATALDALPEPTPAQRELNAWVQTHAAIAQRA